MQAQTPGPSTHIPPEPTSAIPCRSIPCHGKSSSKPLPGIGAGLVDVGENKEAYLFRVTLPGVSRHPWHFRINIQTNGTAHIEVEATTGTTGGRRSVTRYSQEFEMVNVPIRGFLCHYSTAWTSSSKTALGVLFGPNVFLRGLWRKQRRNQADIPTLHL